MGEDVGTLVVGDARYSQNFSTSSHGPIYRLSARQANGETVTLTVTEDAFRSISDSWTMTATGYGERWPREESGE